MLSFIQCLGGGDITHYIWSSFITLHNSFGCVPCDMVPHEHNSCLIPRFLMYGEHSSYNFDFFDKSMRFKSQLLSLEREHHAIA